MAFQWLGATLGSSCSPHTQPCLLLLAPPDASRRDIETHYDEYDGFVILHGTDTMAYTASVLSFMLRHLTKPIVLTGSQIPFSRVRNDALGNMLGALTVASHFPIPEVCL